jgi:hypothetical protein
VTVYAPLTASELTKVYVHAPAVQVAAPFSLPAPATATDTLPLSFAALPQEPPTDNTVALLRYGKVRATPLTVVTVTTGAVLSTVIVCVPVVLVFDAASLCVPVTLYTPSPDSAVVGANVQKPAVHGAVPLWVLAPVIETVTPAPSPGAVPHVPPKDVTVTLVWKGKVRVEPFTEVSVTTGGMVSIVIDFVPVAPVLPAESAWVALTVYVPLAASAVANVYVQLPDAHVAAPFSLPAPPTVTDTVELSPEAVPQTPPTVVEAVFVVNGNVRAVPLTVVSVTVGAVLSTVIACAPLEPVFPAVSDCVAVTE